MPLNDKIVFITGASSGIGAELARELARRGARLGLVARRDDRLREVAAEIAPQASSPVRVSWASADVTREDDLHAAFERLYEELGGVDIVVANAGYGRAEPPHKFKPGRAATIYDTNLFGMLRAFDWALPRFLEHRAGHLVGVASIASFVGFTDWAAYCGSKAAMRVHLQSLRVSLRAYGITVTTICPGFVDTELTEKNRSKMPFLWDAGRAARKIADAIDRRRGEVVFPWQMKILLQGSVRWLPTGLVERFLTRSAPHPSA